MSQLERWRQDGWLRPVDAALADALRRARPDTDPQVLLAAALCSRALAFGHGALPLDRLEALCGEIDGERTPPPAPAPEAWLGALRASPWVACDPAADDAPLVLEGDRLFLRRYHRHECDIADDLRRRAAAAPAPPDAATAAWREQRLQVLFPHLLQDPADPQAVAARELLAQRVLLLTGGPGTGKTRSVARALVLAVEDALRAGATAPRIGLAAPTGKAAARLAESMRESLATLDLAPAVTAALPGEARTLHRLLGAAPGRREADAPLPFDLLVVDEASMVDLALMARLLAALPREARLLLVGDPDQLPSVDAGDVLAALAAAPALPQVRLQQVHRQAAGGGLDELARDVRAGEPVPLLRRLADQGYDGVAWRPGSERELPAALLAEAVPAFRALAAATDPAQALCQARRFRVLTALREGPSGSVALNARLAAALQPAGAGAPLAFHGALLMITANSPRHGLFNGDVGIAWQEADGALRVWFESPDGARAWLPSTLPAHEAAFALTVHKAQGSEFEHVWLVLPERGARVLSRELLYTGITRARAGFTLWARAPVLGESVARRSERWSGLAARLRASADEGCGSACEE